MEKYKFNMQKLARDSVDRKVRFKLYKAGTRWLVAGMATLTFGLTAFSLPGQVKADTAASTNNGDASTTGRNATAAKQVVLKSSQNNAASGSTNTPAATPAPTAPTNTGTQSPAKATSTTGSTTDGANGSSVTANQPAKNADSSTGTDSSQNNNSSAAEQKLSQVDAVSAPEAPAAQSANAAAQDATDNASDVSLNSADNKVTLTQSDATSGKGTFAFGNNMLTLTDKDGKTSTIDFNQFGQPNTINVNNSTPQPLTVNLPGQKGSTTVSKNADGSSTFYFPDGTKDVVKPGDTTQQTISTGGSFVTNSDGTITFTNPDKTVTKIDPKKDAQPINDKTTVVFVPKGDTSIQPSEMTGNGTFVVNPSGTITFTDQSGKTLTIDPNNLGKPTIVNSYKNSGTVTTPPLILPALRGKNGDVTYLSATNITGNSLTFKTESQDGTYTSTFKVKLGDKGYFPNGADYAIDSSGVFFPLHLQMVVGIPLILTRLVAIRLLVIARS
ncbi:KxYKxGKxW signal peptide domain-containing protein [Secundilactobacillus silagei]|uniref:KxYKxGKxW signal peptide domain-containing protein n=1 Tax=Secundilactobacillus silagei TaxID=1293415 RepID=UPI0006D04833|nr:KxYKxGKxW signal peptide domain-containing protein [Secundilactobacillus silagei]